jgi:hypothetical protein
MEDDSMGRFDDWIEDRAARRLKHTEAQLWKVMRGKLTHCAWDRIENSVSAGISDLHVTSRGISRWIELKVFKSNKLIFQPSQPPWIARQTMHGGKVLILARKHDQNLDRLLLFKGCQLPQLLEAGVASIDGAPPTGRADVLVIEQAVFQTPRPFDWKALEHAMFSTPWGQLK